MSIERKLMKEAMERIVMRYADLCDRGALTEFHDFLMKVVAFRDRELREEVVRDEESR